MPYCTKCGSTDYDCTDGFYYCTVCNTQSQDIYVEEVGFNTDYQTGFRCADVKYQSKKLPVKKQLNLGRPWKTHEAYQVILKEMTKAVISMGARKELMDVVFRLWVLYLSKCGIAFVKPSDSNASARAFQSYTMKSRQLFPGTVEDPSIKPIKLKANYKLKKMSAYTSELNKLREAMKDELFFDEDNQAVESNEDQGLLDLVEWEIKHKKEKSTDCKVTSIPEGLLLGSIRGEAAYSEKSIQQLGMDKLLTLLHIGLMYTNSQMMAGDLVRWVTDGQIPYVQAMSLLPDNMCFFGRDFNDFFVQRLPSTASILLQSKQLMWFLELEKRPVVDVALLISRYIVELNLPGELHHFVANLMGHQKPSGSYNCEALMSFPDFASLATAYIVISLKLLFGIDGITEKKLSAYARQASVQTRYEQPLFVWDEWVAWSDQRMAQVEGSRFPSDMKNLKHLQDVEKVMNHFDLVFELPDRRSKHNPKYKTHQLDHAKKVHCEVREMADQVKWPYAHSRSFYSAKLTDFSACTLKYITDREDSHPIDDPMNSSEDDMFVDLDEDKEPACNVAIQDVTENRTKQVESVVAQAMASLEFPYKMSASCSASHPLSYHWLLTHCANHINSTAEIINHCVRMLELAYVTPQTLLTHSELVTFNYFVRKYFTDPLGSIPASGLASFHYRRAV